MEIDNRVEEYLSDKIQTTADLANIESLLGNVRQQHELLQDQLAEVRKELAETRASSESYANDLREEASQFKHKQAEIDRRLKIVTQSETSDDGVKKLRTIMDKCAGLDIARGYCELLQEVEGLQIEARDGSEKSPQEALVPYLRLKEISSRLTAAQPAAEGAAPHLSHHIELSTKKLWTDLKEDFGIRFERTLQKMHWPDKDLRLAGPLEQEWILEVKRLLDLQGPELDLHGRATLTKLEEPVVLLPLQIMARPLELRFAYHFDDDRPTNKLDKPEYFLSHVIGLLNTYDEFFAIFFQPIIREYFRNSDLAMTSIYIDSTSALITALLPMLRRKLFNILPQILQNPQLLSHLMHELMSFDTSLRDEWDYDGGNRIEGWKGLAWDVLVKKSIFVPWLEAEKNFAMTRYQHIIEATDAFEIDYDSVDSSITKPTYAAVRVNDLLETITDRYRPLQSFQQKIQFLIDIQIAIFDLFHTRLRDSLSAFQTLTSTIGRNLQGAPQNTKTDLSGIAGLDRLCRIYGSAEYVERKMRDWSDDVFFLDLWEELQDRVTNNTSKDGKLAGNMSVSHVAERTSTTVISAEEVDTGALFDETASAYRTLRTRTEDVLEDRLVTGVRDAIRPYGRINPWSSLAQTSAAADDDPISPTSELTGLIAFLDSHLTFLHRALSPAALRRITRQLCLALQSSLWDSVLMRYTFSRQGIAQFAKDVSILGGIIDKYAGAGQTDAGMRRLADAIRLLSLPETSKQGNAIPEADVAIDDEDLGAWGADEDNDDAEPSQADDPAGQNTTATNEADPVADIASVSLWDAEKRIFRSNESARDVLESLGLESLTEADARSVLGRRIDLGER